ncbi:MAG: response regulator [Ignavibacteriae bacterium]|nr:response regulator [Ignavibacteriota bacterium]
MNTKEKEFQKKLLMTFRVEAEEHLKTLSNGLLSLEKTDKEKMSGIIETIFREAHSLKGAARAVNLRIIEKVCQSLESVFSAMKKGLIQPHPDMFNIFHKSVNQLSEIISLEDNEININMMKNIDMIITRIDGILKNNTEIVNTEKSIDSIGNQIGKEKKQVEISSSNFQLETGYLKISSEKLNSLMLQAQELQSVKLQNKRNINELKDVNKLIEQWAKQSQNIKSSVKTLQFSLMNKEKYLDERNRKDYNDSLTKISSFFEWGTDFIKNMDRKIRTIQSEQTQDDFMFGLMADNLLEDMKNIQLLKFSSLLEIFPKMLRDLSYSRGKEVDFEVIGSEIEIDRRILEEIKDPLIHIIRNCVDHGIEKPSERINKGKSHKGLIRINISQSDADKIKIIISDDGAGIDLLKVKASALKLGICNLEELEKLSSNEILNLVFYSGVSTSPFITDLSGRGLGLPIVKEKIEKLNGEVSIETAENIGTSFNLILPVTTATIGGLIVNESGQLFVIPSIYIDNVLRLKKSEIKSIENKNVFKYYEQFIPIVRLRDVLNLTKKPKLNEDEDSIKLVVLNSQQKKVGFQVDEIVNEQEVIVKELGKQLARVRNVYGATTIGGRELIIILNVPDLVKSTITAPDLYKAAISPENEERKHKRILVVEDSITARTLLRGILESSGFDVRTAVDGLDAITILKGENFDMVISDVDMPNMNGFLLTEKIRADNKLSDLPVILVTSLDSRTDRERGIDVGANAYIVKSSFDESNLIEVIKRLV